MIETPTYGLTVFKVHFGLVTLKAYSKGEHVLRFEAVVHNTRQLHLGSVLEHFPEIVARLTAMLDRFTTMLDCVDVAFLSGDILDELPRSSRLGATRVGGIDLNKQRVRAVLAAVVALAAAPRGCFTVAELAEKVHSMTGETDYRVRQAAYDLRKLRAKGLVARPEHSRRYQVPAQAARTITALSVLREHVVSPILAGLRSPRQGRKPSAWTRVDRDYESLRIGMQTLFGDLGISTTAARGIDNYLSICRRKALVGCVRPTGQEGLNGPVGHLEVAGPGAHEQVGLEAAVEIGATGHNEVVTCCHVREPGALLGPIAAVVALEPGKTGCGQLQEDALKLGGIKAERKRMGKHRHRSRAFCRFEDSGGLETCFGDVPRSPLGQPAVKSDLNTLCGAVGDKYCGEMRPADDRATGSRPHLFEADGQPEVPQALHESLVASRAVPAETFQLVLQRTLARLDEVAEDVHRPGREGARDLATRDEPDAESLGADLGLIHTAESVVVGESHRLAACDHGQLYDPCRRFRAVRASGVGMEIDHGA